MTINIEKAFELPKDGILISEGGTRKIWIGGGDNAPTHNAPRGSIYFRTNKMWQ